MLRLAPLLFALTLTACFGGSSNPSRNAPDGAGEVCGVSGLIGTPIGTVQHNGNRACTVSNAVDLHSVSGVQLTGDTRLNCTAAKALNTWVKKTAKPATCRETGEALASLQTWSSFRCSNRPGGRISEHAKGNAIDIGSLTTTSGARISVLSDWGSRQYGPLLAKLKSGACGPFGVVLHPDNDAAHKDHFHFDTSNRSGRYVYCKRNP